MFHEMRQAGSGVLLASAEQLLVHVDTHEGRSTDLPPYLLERLDAIAAAHAGCCAPTWSAGRWGSGDAQ